MHRGVISFLTITVLLSLVGCKVKGAHRSADQGVLFQLGYGNFEDEVNLFSMKDIGDICTTATMQAGFFYIVNGEAQKIMVFNSYGDLLAVYYNKDHYETVGNTLPQKSRSILWHPIDMDFSYTGKIAVDTHKRIYATAKVSKGKEIYYKEENLLYSQVVVYIDTNSEGATHVHYIGQEGEGGNPFPYIKNIYTTVDDELVVVCVTNTGLCVYWYTMGEDGLHKVRHKVIISRDDIPHEKDEFITMENIAPAPHGDMLYLKVDYYSPIASSDDDNSASGIDYSRTLVYPFDITKAIFGEAVNIPSFTQSSTIKDSAGGSGVTSTYKLPYDFLGVTQNSTCFFMITSVDGFSVESVHLGGDYSIQKRSFAVDHDDVLYYTFSLSQDGIISGLLAYKDRVDITWWHTDLMASAQ